MLIVVMMCKCVLSCPRWPVCTVCLDTMVISSDDVLFVVWCLALWLVCFVLSVYVAPSLLIVVCPTHSHDPLLVVGSPMFSACGPTSQLLRPLWLAVQSLRRGSGPQIQG